MANNNVVYAILLLIPGGFSRTRCLTGRMSKDTLSYWHNLPISLAINADIMITECYAACSFLSFIEIIYMKKKIKEKKLSIPTV